MNDVSKLVKARGLSHLKFGFLGTGNMNQAVMSAVVRSGLVPIENIFATNRTERKLTKICNELGVTALKNNEELVNASDVIFVGVKPQNLAEVLEPISTLFDESQVLISLAAGVSLQSLKKMVPMAQKRVRIMPNTPVKIGSGVVGYCLSPEANHLSGMMEDLLSPLGLVMSVQEGEEFEALTVSCSSGVGFVFEFMQYWQEWLEEHGFGPEDARSMTVKTFLGASELATQLENLSLQELQSKVTSRKGVTAAGLDSMRELELERGLRYSFEKAVLRDRELG